MNFQLAQITLRIEQSEIIELSDQYQEQVGDIVVRVHNDGFLSTEDSVIVYFREQNVDQNWSSQTIQIDARSYTDAVFTWKPLKVLITDSNTMLR